MEKVILDDDVLEYEISNKDTEWTVEIDGEEETFFIEKKDEDFIVSNKERNKFKIADVYHGNDYSIIWVEDKEFFIKEEADEESVASEESEKDIKSSMPGVIKEIKCEEGQQVKKGDTLIVFESMKVLNELKSNVNGTVKKIHVTEGAQVGPAELLVEIDAEEEGQEED